MTELNNISVTTLDDGMVSLLINQQPISEKYQTKFEASIVEDIKALENMQKLKLFEQFIFSHTDLNFEHAYYYVTGIEKLDDAYRLVKNFVYRIKVDNQPEVEHVVTNQGKAMTTEDVRNFIHAHIQKSLNDYTDINYAY